MPPSENEKMSTLSKPSAVMKLTASSAIASTVSGTVPVEAPTPRLSKAMTWCLLATGSMTRGSQLSRVPARWTKKITGTPPLGPSSRYA